MFIGTVVIIIYIIKYFTGMFKNKEELKIWIDSYIKEKGKKSLHIWC